MSNLLSLTWRFLLAAALVLNPVVGAASMLAAGASRGSVSAAVSASEKMPPCHAMAHHAATPKDDSEATDKGHGCGCGNPACQFGVCCTVGTLDVPAPLFARAMHAGAQALPSRDFQQADAPPPARMIRPPIA